ncbi:MULTISPECIES: DMT family transporter [unclassified Minwuia]|jgi:drug/metabolite transporter (DMT)-like permease|uniref:DMT family transporter n=1 Tax=unclassified Minwuia TaxID=2618799 RepID=UPI002479CF47|nr:MULTISPECIES: DMT family transporter [unclassified Minwuia]
MSLNRRTALIVALVGLFAVSHGVIFIRLAGDAPALLIALARVAIATAVMAPFGLLALSARAELPAGAMRRAVVASLLGGLFLALHFASWITSLERISIAESTILVSLTPVWVALIDVATGRGMPNRRLLLAIALCLTGTLVLALDGVQRLDGDPAGLLLAVAGGLFMALYLISGRRARAVLQTSSYATLCYGTAALLLGAAVGALDVEVTGYGWPTWTALLALGLVSQVIGHTSYNWTLATLPPAFVAICLLGEPVLGALLGWLYLGEAVSMAAFGAGILILSGIGIAISAEIRRG